MRSCIRLPRSHYAKKSTNFGKIKRFLHSKKIQGLFIFGLDYGSKCPVVVYLTIIYSILKADLTLTFFSLKTVKNLFISVFSLFFFFFYNVVYSDLETRN